MTQENSSQVLPSYFNRDIFEGYTVEEMEKFAKYCSYRGNDAKNVLDSLEEWDKILKKSKASKSNNRLGIIRDIMKKASSVDQSFSEGYFFEDILDDALLTILASHHEVPKYFKSLPTKNTSRIYEEQFDLKRIAKKIDSVFSIFSLIYSLKFDQFYAPNHLRTDTDINDFDRLWSIAEAQAKSVFLSKIGPNFLADFSHFFPGSIQLDLSFLNKDLLARNLRPKIFARHFFTHDDEIEDSEITENGVSIRLEPINESEMRNFFDSTS